MSTSGSVDPETPDAPSFANKHPRKWNHAEVLEFLEANKERYSLDNDVISLAEGGGFWKKIAEAHRKEACERPLQLTSRFGKGS